MIRLAVVTSHPIQYNAPLFKMLASRPELEVKVFYTLGKSYAEVKDKGFGKKITWDIPLLEGYEYEFLENISTAPGTSHFKGIINPAVIELVEAFRPTAILVFGWSLDSHLKVLRYFKRKVPVYFRGDSTLLDERKGIRTLQRRLFLRWIYTYVDKAFYVGTQNKQYFLQHGVKEQDLVFAPHAIDNDRFGNDAAFAGEAVAIRNKLGIPAQNTVFLFSGKFEKKKSPLLLVKAFKALHLNNCALLLVGNGVLEDEMRAAAAGEEHIYFLPFQNQAAMPAVYRAADVLVLPSGGPGETWGLAVNEAMACGLPIIVSDKVGCSIDLVQNEVNGYIFRSGDAESLQEKLSLCAAKSKTDLQEMGNTSRNIIRNWNYEKICEAIVNEVG